MSKKRLDTFDMETRFDGLIKLLAEGLYSEKDIFVRELVQNSHDSIIRRKDVEPDLAGRIDVDIDTAKQTISFTDNGIGMDERDIREFLSVIGSTGTGIARDSGMRLSHELIGQFGIGMLSAFVVAEKVYVDTLKRGSDLAYEWRNSGSEECQLYSSDRSNVGSTITVFLRDDYTFFLSEQKIREIIIRYCDFISVPIYLNKVGPVNTVDAPWNRSYPSAETERDAYGDFINRRFTDFALDVFPFIISGPYQAKGILYISDRHVADINTGGFLDIFIRHMLVKQADTSLLPSWAKFIRGVIDSPDLKPTAARDNIQSSDSSFQYIREKLGEIIVKRLTYLAQNNPERFRTINEWHHYHLKGMAFFNEEFFNDVSDLLLFETNQGMMSLKDYLPKNEPMRDGRAPLYYFSYKSSAGQYYRMAQSKGLTVINAGDRFDEEVIIKYAKKYASKVSLQQFDTLADGVLFDPLMDEDVGRFINLEQRFTYVLNRSGLNVQVETKRFMPKEIPAVIVESARTKAEENLRALLHNPGIRMAMEDAWNEVIRDEHRKSRKLALNAGSPLIESLLQVQDPRLLDQMMLTIYNNAMMYAFRMDPENLSIVHDSMVRIMQQTINIHIEKAELQRRLEEYRQRDIADIGNNILPEHIRVFMITPYANEYRMIERAIRNILECAPYFFEVRLARDYTHAGAELVDDLQLHIAESHAFVADITGLNPNVMMEVGAIHLRRDNRPMYVLHADFSDKEKIPADLGAKLRIPYGDLSDNPENIEEIIRDAIKRREDTEQLCKQRKARFLSKTLLKKLPLGLQDSVLEEISRRYVTIEALLEAGSDTVQQQMRIKPYQAEGLISEIEELNND